MNRKTPQTLKGIGCGITLALLVACGSNTTPSKTAGWNIQIELGTLNTPEQPNNLSWNQQTRQALVDGLTTLHATNAIVPQVVSNTTITGLFQFTVDKKPVIDAVYLQNDLKSSKFNVLTSGQYWNDFQITVPDASTEQALTITYQNNTSTVRRKLDKTSILPLPVFQKATLVDNQLDTSWTTVPGAKSYILTLVNQNNEGQSWILPANTVSLKQTLNFTANLNQSYSLKLYAISYDVAASKNSAMATLPKPNISGQITTVKATQTPGSLKAYSPTSINMTATTGNYAQSTVTLTSGATGLEVAYNFVSSNLAFSTNGNFLKLSPNESKTIPVTGSCYGNTGTLTADLVLTTNDPTKSTITVPLTLNCVKIGDLYSYSHSSKALTGAAETGQSTTVPVSVQSGYQGLDYSFSVVSGSNFITVPAGPISLNGYSSKSSDITLTCSDKAEIRTGTLRLTTNDPAYPTIDTTVNLNCYAPVLVNELWSKPASFPVINAAWNASGTRLAVGSSQYNDGALLLDGQLKASGQTRNFAAQPTHLSWRNDTQLFLLAKDAIQLWDTTTNKAIYAWNHDFNTDNVFGLESNPTKNQVAISGASNGTNKTIVYSIDGKTLATLNNLYNLSFSPDGNWAAGYYYSYDYNTGITKRELQILDTTNFKVSQSIDASKYITNNWDSSTSASTKWDETGKYLMFMLNPYYETKTIFGKYEVSSKTISTREVTDAYLKQFLVKSASEVVYMSLDGQLKLLNLDTGSIGASGTMTLTREAQTYRLVGTPNAGTIAVFPSENYYYNTCGYGDLVKFNASLQLQNTYGVSTCNQQNRFHLNAAGEVWASDGSTVRKLAAGTGTTTHLYNMGPLLKPTNTLSDVNTIVDQTGYFSDTGGYLYTYDFSKNQLVNSLRVQPSTSYQIIPNPEQSQVFTRGDSSIRVHDLQSGNMAMTKVNDELPINTRWLGTNRILLRKSTTSDYTYTFADYDFVQDKELKTYSFKGDYYYTQLLGVTSKYLVIRNSDQLHTIDRTTGTSNMFFSEVSGGPNVEQSYVINSDKWMIVTLYKSYSVYDTALMDLVSGNIVKILVKDAEAPSQVTSAVDNNGKLLILATYPTVGLKVFQVN